MPDCYVHQWMGNGVYGIISVQLVDGGGVYVVARDGAYVTVIIR